MNSLSSNLLAKNIRGSYVRCLKLLSLVCIMMACGGLDQSTTETDVHYLTDASNRKVRIVSDLPQIVTMRAGALRLMLYMDLADQVAYLEKNDLTRQVPYMIAYPELKELPLIGAGNNYDPEVLATSKADLIISTYMEATEADALQAKVGIPVFTLSYGDLYHYKKDFYTSLSHIGAIFDKSERAQQLIAYIEGSIEDIQNRIKGQVSIPSTAYIGGIAYNGVQGITSTRAQYPPFVYLKLDHPFDALPHSFESIGMGQKNSIIDKEQILEWNPDWIFLDVSGKSIWEQEWEEPIFASLTAKKNVNTYSVLPFNWHSINYENLICNMWFIGKLVYPDAFQDIDLQQKYREVFVQFYGRDIYDEVMHIYNPYQSIP